MKKTINYLMLIFCAIIIAQCTIFKKQIKNAVVLKIVVPENYATIKENASYIKYVKLHPAIDYQNKFMQGFLSEAKITPNITIDNNSLNPDYIVEIKSLILTESDFIDTVKDVKSEFNGKQILLNKVEAFGELNCLNAKTNKMIGLSCNDSKSRQEKLNNNRTLNDLVNGTNKTHSTYHQKLLSDSIALQLASDVGH